MQSEEFNSNICSLTMTGDKRIASGNYDDNISISSYDLKRKEWNVDILKDKAHQRDVRSLSTLTGNRLLSGSVDCFIKVWSISNNDIQLIKGIKHTSALSKVIPLTKERFASSSSDGSVKIWKDDETYKCISTLTHGKEFDATLGYG